MKHFNTKIFMAFMMVISTIIYANAQMASGQEKFVGNILNNTIPESYDTYWNQVTPENSGKWGTVEGVRDTMNWTDLDLAYNYAQDMGFPFKQHAFVWGMQEPSWISGLSAAEQAAEVEEWIQAYAQRYPNTNMIDVVNEPLHVIPSYADAIGGSGATGWDWVIWSFEKARQYMPDATLILNDYGILGKKKETRDYLDIINLLKDRNLIDGIGVQAHGLEYAQNSAIQTTLDELAATGIPIYISELDLEFADDNEQLSRYQSLFPLLYEHHGVVGVTLWGYIAGQHWKPDAYLLGEITTLGSFTASTTYQDYTVAGSGPIQVHFTNDNEDNSNDLETDYVVLDGTTYQAEDMEINTGVYQDNSCGGSFSQVMHCNGYIQFPSANSSITVRARGINGTETMEIQAVDMSIERPALQWLRVEYFGDANEAPMASFNFTTTELTADFDGSASSDSDGTITSWEWDFGDGTTGSGEITSHTYDASGNYTVTLMVTDDGGATATDVQEVAVSDGNSVPNASFTFTTSLLTADFDASGSSDSDGTISTYAWDFGDGTTGSGEITSHTYDASGNYSVTLTVTDDGGATDQESQVVSVSDGTGSISMHVQDIITYTLSAGAGNKKGVAEVTIHDDQESPVSGATVTGTFTGTFNEAVTAQTGSDGVAILQTQATAKGSVTVDFCVDDVSHSTLAYDSGSNDVTCTGSNGRRSEELSKPAKADIKLFPNPASNGSFSVRFLGEFTPGEATELSIYNLNGRLVHQDVVKQGENEVHLNTSLTPGIYLLRVHGIDTKLIIR